MAKRPVRPGQGSSRAVCRPFLEALEDRYVLSSLGATPALVSAPPLVDQLAGVALTAYAGKPFTGTVATFASPSVTGLKSTILWQTGDASPGIIGNVGSGTFDVAGSNTFAQAGTYTIVVSIVTGSGNLAQVRTTITVLAANMLSNVLVPDGGANYVAATNPMILNGDGAVGLKATPPSAFTATSMTDGASISLYVASTSSAVTISPPAATQASQPQNTAFILNVASGAAPRVPSQGQTAAQTQPTPAVRVTITEVVPWSSLRDQGLNRPPAGSPASAAPGITVEHVSWFNLSEQVAAAAGENLVPAGTVVQIGGKQVGGQRLSNPELEVSITLVVPAKAARGLDVDGSYDSRQNTEPESPRDMVYHQPLHRVADRSDLGVSLSGQMAPPALAVPESSSADAVSFLVPFDRSRQEIEDLEMRGGFSGRLRNSSSVGSLLETAAAWAIVQALHSAEVQRVLAKNPALRSSGKGAAPLPPVIEPAT